MAESDVIVLADERCLHASGWGGALRGMSRAPYPPDGGRRDPMEVGGYSIRRQLLGRGVVGGVVGDGRVEPPAGGVVGDVG